MKTNPWQYLLYTVISFFWAGVICAQPLNLSWDKTDGNANVYTKTAVYDSHGNIWTIALGDNSSANQMILCKYNASGIPAFTPIYVNNAIARGMVADASGNVIIVGEISGTSVFGSYSLTSVGATDAFMVKYDVAGNCMWAHTLCGTVSSSSSVAWGIAVNGSSIFITGSYKGTIDFDWDISTSNLTSAGGADGFIARYTTADGSFYWAKSFGGSSTDVGTSVAADTSGSAYVTGYFSGTAAFGHVGTLPVNLTSLGGQDIFITRFAADGTFKWAKKLGGSDNDKGNQVLTDGINVYVTGSYSGTAIFNPAGSDILIANGGTDAFVAKYTVSGTYNWARSFGGSGNDVGYGIALDSLGNVYATGQIEDTAYFNGGADTGIISAGSADIYIAKYSAGGDYNWALGLGGTGNDIGYGILYANGNLYNTGAFSNTVDFDPTTGTSNLVSTGLTDAYLAVYNEITITGINDNYSSGAGIISVYPNPAGNTINIHTNNNAFFTTDIFSATGSLVYRQPGTGGNLPVDISALSAGIYYARITTGSQTYITKFVKQ